MSNCTEDGKTAGDAFLDNDWKCRGGHPLEKAPVQQVVVEQEDPVFIKGIYERLGENKPEPPVDTFITFGHHINLLVRQEWIEMKDALLAGTEENLHRTIFLRGTSGRGKTSFVYYLMYCILISAKKTKAELESDPHAFVESKKRKAEQESDLLIGYVCDEGSSVAKFLLTLSHVKRVASIPSRVHYYIADTDSDENRTNLAKYFMMVVDSDDSRGKTEFRKRLQEANGETFLIPPPTREQMHLMFAGIHSSDEIDFRLDVVGCNPRLLRARCCNNFRHNFELEQVIKNTCVEILGYTETDVDPTRFNWVMSIVMQAIEAAISGENKSSVTSLFREDIREDSGLLTVRFTSTFMCFLAGKFRDKFATSSLTSRWF